jgi:hypothetical protein
MLKLHKRTENVSAVITKSASVILVVAFALPPSGEGQASWLEATTLG